MRGTAPHFSTDHAKFVSASYPLSASTMATFCGRRTFFAVGMKSGESFRGPRRGDRRRERDLVVVALEDRQLLQRLTDPGQLAEAAFKAIRVATSGTQGPVVLVIPEVYRIVLFCWVVSVQKLSA